MTEKVFSPLPTKPVVINQEVTDEEKHVASYNITKAIRAETNEESIASSLIAISITLHAIWEMLNKKEPPTVSGKQELRSVELKKIREWLASPFDPNDIHLPEKEETE